MKRMNILFVLMVFLAFGSNAAFAENVSTVNSTEMNQSANSAAEEVQMTESTSNSSSATSESGPKEVVSEESVESDEVIEQQDAPTPSLSYRSYLNGTGWQEFQKEDSVSGTEEQDQQIEAFELKMDNLPEGSWLEYTSSIKGSGWEKVAKKNGEISGQIGKGLEAFRITLKGDLTETHQIYYRAKVKNFGWLDWTSDGEAAGSSGCNYPIEAMQVKLVNQGKSARSSNSGSAYIEKPKISYATHIQSSGWQSAKSDGDLSGTTGQSKRLEAIRMTFTNASGTQLEYKSHIQDSGWDQSFKKNNEISGIPGKSKRLEAIQIRLGSELSQYFDVYYRVHAQNFGWMGWTKNGASAGTEKCAYRLEGIEIRIVPKGEAAPGSTNRPYVAKPALSYQTHIQSVGWQGFKNEGVTSGTSGQAKRLEAIQIKLGASNFSGTVQYRTHISNIGWEGNYRQAEQISGTTGQAKRLEAIQIKFTGELAANFDIYYRVHAQNLGWMGWAKNGASAGTEKLAYRLEAIQIKVIPKSQAAPGNTNRPHIIRPALSYQTHVQSIGWQGFKNEGTVSGTSGQAKRLEAIQLKLSSSNMSGAIQYRTHISNVGWEKNYRQTGQVSGTTGQAKRLEAIQIRLTGELAANLDIYYRVHAQNFGWMGWAKNGASAGTERFAYRLEAIQIKLVPKGQAAPGSTNNAFRKGYVLLNVPFYDQYKAGAPYGCEAASMLQGLHYKGKAKKYTLQSILKEMPIDPSNNPNQGFAGSPYRGIPGVYQTIYPKPLASWGKKYGTVVDISGATPTDLKNEVSRNNPVVIYVTSSFRAPIYHRYFFGVAIENAHIMTLDGFNEQKGQYHVSDPVLGKYWVNKSSFERIYNLKRFAVAVRG